MALRAGFLSDIFRANKIALNCFFPVDAGVVFLALRDGLVELLPLGEELAEGVLGAVVRGHRERRRRRRRGGNRLEDGRRRRGGLRGQPRRDGDRLAPGAGFGQHVAIEQTKLRISGKKLRACCM